MEINTVSDPAKDLQAARIRKLMKMIEDLRKANLMMDPFILRSPMNPNLRLHNLLFANTRMPAIALNLNQKIVTGHYPNIRRDGKTERWFVALREEWFQ